MFVVVSKRWSQKVNLLTTSLIPDSLLHKYSCSASSTYNQNYLLQKISLTAWVTSSDEESSAAVNHYLTLASVWSVKEMDNFDSLQI